jgi:hypothetical protein
MPSLYRRGGPSGLIGHQTGCPAFYFEGTFQPYKESLKRRCQKSISTYFPANDRGVEKRIKNTRFSVIFLDFAQFIRMMEEPIRV